MSAPKCEARICEPTRRIMSTGRRLRELAAIALAVTARVAQLATYSPHQRDRQTTNELRLIGAGPNRRADRPMPIGGA
jgi:hypothetical protein